jgi:hypothetical protein
VLLLYLPLYWYRKRVEDVRDTPATEAVAPPAGGIATGGVGD